MRTIPFLLAAAVLSGCAMSERQLREDTPLLLTAQLPPPRQTAIECIGREMQGIRMSGADPQVTADLTGVRVTLGLGTMVIVDVAGEPPIAKVYTHSADIFRDQVYPFTRSSIRICGGKVTQEWKASAEPRQP